MVQPALAALPPPVPAAAAAVAAAFPLPWRTKPPATLGECVVYQGVDTQVSLCTGCESFASSQSTTAASFAQGSDVGKANVA